MASTRPSRAGDFLLLAPLRVGGPTEVWSAVRVGDPSGRVLVYKRPRLGERASGAAAQAIEREAVALRGSPSPHLPELEASGTLGGLPFVAMSWVDGIALSELAMRPLEPPALARLGVELCTALGALHARGRIHGDVAPSNVLVSELGDVSLVDLGTSIPLGDPRLTAGQPGYAAPEVLRPGEASAAQDVYGAALILAELALGRRLFSELQLVEAARRPALPPAVAAVPGVGALLSRALDRAEDQRPSLDELRRGLLALGPDADALGAFTRAEPEPRAPTTERRVVAVDLVAAPAADTVLEGTIEAPARAPEDPRREILVAPTAPREPTPQPRRARLVLLLGGVALAGVLAGTVVGRLGSRPRTVSATLAAQVPSRVSIEVDGKAITPERRIDGLRPGAHTITVRFAKQRLEIPVKAEAGAELVLVPIVRGATPLDD